MHKRLHAQGREEQGKSPPTVWLVPHQARVDLIWAFPVLHWCWWYGYTLRCSRPADAEDVRFAEHLAPACAFVALVGRVASCIAETVNEPLVRARKKVGMAPDRPMHSTGRGADKISQKVVGGQRGEALFHSHPCLVPVPHLQCVMNPHVNCGRQNARANCVARTRTSE